MATRIIEYDRSERMVDRTVVPQSDREQPAMTATGTSAQSAAFGAGTAMVCVQSDEAVYVKFGADPTATTNSYRLQAGAENFWVAQAGQKVAIRT
jgi:hypothetical protein